MLVRIVEVSECCTALRNCVPSWSCSKAVYKPVWHIPLLSVQWINYWCWAEELSVTCRVSWQNKFVKLVLLVGFIIKKYMQYFKATHIRPPATGLIPLYFVKYSAYQKLCLVAAEYEILIMTQLYVIHQLSVRRSAFEDTFFLIWTPLKDVFVPGRYNSICAGS